MELTKAFFEQTIKNLATKDDLKNLATKGDLESIRTDMRDLESRLITRIDESQAQLAQMTKRGFDDLAAKLDVRSKVEELEHQMHEVRLELNLA
jgi:hypothetical protein